MSTPTPPLAPIGLPARALVLVHCTAPDCAALVPASAARHDRDADRWFCAACAAEREDKAA